MAIDVAGSIRSVRVVEPFAKLMSERGIPAVIGNEDGLELVSMPVPGWMTADKVEKTLRLRMLDRHQPTCSTSGRDQLLSK